MNNYLWCEVDDWPRWERTLMNGLFIHHTGMVYGDYLESMLDACLFVPGLDSVAL
ncbi:MAG: hypothetical protein GXP32_10495 [Kiritimatiellaeota bacterium]|nr:hypothetical protein [Kiritimatiellota bacterium]